MKTPSISPLVNLTSGSAPTAKPSDASPNTPFSQMLSREMTRPNTREQSRANAADTNKPAQAEAKSDSTGSPDKTSAADTPGSSASAAAPEKTGKADKADAKRDDDDAPHDDTTASDASAELLALVASLAQPAAKAAPTGKGAGDTEDGDGAAKDDPAQLLAASIGARSGKTQTEEDAAQGDAAAALRGAASGKDETANMLQRLNGRAQAAATNTEDEPKQFDAKLTQAVNDKAEAAQGTGKKSEDTDLSALQAALAKHGAHQPQETQQASATPINVAALSANQAQPVQSTVQAAGQATELLAPRVGTDGWNQALGQKVVWMVGNEQQTASLTLNPPDLGPLQVVLQVSDNQAVANFTAAQPEVRHALESAMPKLREMLGDAGIQLSQANVSAGTPNNQQFEQPSARHGGSAQRGSGGGSDPEPQVRATRSQPITGGQGLVDTFA